MKNLTKNYLTYCELQKGLNHKTIKAYRIDLQQYLDFCHPTSCFFEKGKICNYIEYMHNQYKPKTQKRKIASLKAFFNYLTFEDIISENPFTKINITVREPIILPKTIPLKQLVEILNAAYGQMKLCKSDYSFKCTLRDIAVLELLFATGLRVSELCHLKSNDVNLTDNYVKAFGKGSKERSRHLQ